MQWRLLAGVIVCFIYTQAFGITLSPTVIELNTDHQLTSQLVVSNNSTKTLALEANVRRLTFAPNGTFETSTSSSPNEDILVFPPAAMLAPGKRQTFRIQWLSKVPLEMSQSYFIRFSTADINRSSTQVEKVNGLSTGINLQIHYNALLHVHSSSLQPDIKLHIGEHGSLTLTNTGNRFTFTSLLRFDNLPDDINQTVHKALGEQFVPPHSTITVHSSSIQLPVGIYHGYEN
ncbi:fimbria/pilus periplasmic chaperone [Vibrio alginolyticus]|uniref:fimbria/pilus periplasmic chaperone n=1 Tax=Vibrio TaxID=662 RepID=UPI00146BF2A6|nr:MULTISPECIES: fimbria/pilus periplasmic chaperone [Vibrio]MDF4657349.1 fimbria/pilus periplasmic chaperone [Vibrio parahaemolyticus]MBS9810865.1 fimbria/pilus periplasmic chaperone [Vibrio alginolyticus]MBS9823358.1 fimbria/pilus periplasmic chaperone [Vibrio alginolyticus]MBS9879830.1 fimbria/pilus periplasmic chaperone [Vibrio alginolyticus]MBS9945596.1 fimbria/pilus periplasmic chaperone [Vibrio alginolyticus]